MYNNIIHLGNNRATSNSNSIFMQRPHLTAKVFRYLRTLIGKAAINRGILQNLRFISWQSALFLLNSRTTLFHASSFHQFYIILIKKLSKINKNGSPYPEVTVVNLPSSLMIVHSNAFVYSTCLPLGCLGTVIYIYSYLCPRP